MILLYHAKVLKYTLAWTFSVILRTEYGVPVLLNPRFSAHLAARGGVLRTPYLRTYDSLSIVRLESWDFISTVPA
jgi:hypothetical protein